MHVKRPWLALPLLAGSLGACNTPPVRVEVVPEQVVRAQLESSALTGDEPSAGSRWGLRLIEAEELYEEDPRAVLSYLHDLYVEGPTRTICFTTAELAYLAARRLEDRDLYLMAALYAYELLVSEDFPDPPDVLDRRFRWACDIYNRSVAGAFSGAEPGRLLLEGGSRSLPAGTLEVEVAPASFPFQGALLELLLVDELEVVGLSFRVRDSGLGAPLIAVVARPGDGTEWVGATQATSLPATAFLRVEGGVRQLGHGLKARLELYSTYETTSVTVAGRQIPLEADLSATLAYGTQKADLWRYDLKGFFRGSQALRQNGLILPQPFEPGRIPVVLVHGTASNPSYWAELVNSLSADRDLRGRYQYWLFLYSTGSPIVLSAASLRQELTALVERFDPEGRDEALHRMVVIGHSQGGLLAKLMAVHTSADELARKMGMQSLEELDLDPDVEALAHELYDIEPLPFVERLIFAATPHQGSFLASSWFARLFAKMISLPGEVVSAGERLLSGIPAEKLPPGVERRIPTSLDNMRPGSPFLTALAETPVDPRVHMHSIIPIGQAESPAGADDGVVTYESAHIEGVESEMLVPSPHSCQAHPRTILEVRRILRQHIGLEAKTLAPPWLRARGAAAGSRARGEDR